MDWTAPQHEAIFQWKQQGKIWLHRYEPPLPSLRGWHFVADPAGTESLLQLLSLIESTMLPVERSVKLEQKLVTDYHPIDERKLKRHSIVSPASLKLSIDLDRDEAWRLEEERDRITLQLNRTGLDEFKGGLTRYQANEWSSWPGDYTVGPHADRNGENIFFW